MIRLKDSIAYRPDIKHIIKKRMLNNQGSIDFCLILNNSFNPRLAAQQLRHIFGKRMITHIVIPMTSKRSINGNRTICHILKVGQTV